MPFQLRPPVPPVVNKPLTLEKRTRPDKAETRQVVNCIGYNFRMFHFNFNELQVFCCCRFATVAATFGSWVGHDLSIRLDQCASFCVDCPPTPFGSSPTLCVREKGALLPRRPVYTADHGFERCHHDVLVDAYAEHCCAICHAEFHVGDCGCICTMAHGVFAVVDHVELKT